MKTTHGEDINEDESKVKRQARGSLESLLQKQGVQAKIREQQIRDQAFKDSINPHALNEALVRLITVLNLSDHCIEWAEFRNLLSICNLSINSILCTSHTTIPSHIKKTFEEHKAIVKQKLRNSLSKIHVTTDIWTANVTQQPYRAVVGHFDEEKGVLRKVLLALKEHHGKHSSKALQRPF